MTSILKINIHYNDDYLCLKLVVNFIKITNTISLLSFSTKYIYYYIYKNIGLLSINKFLILNIYNISILKRYTNTIAWNIAMRSKLLSETNFF